MIKKILAIGHSFVLAQNRDIFRWVSENSPIEVHVAAPDFIKSGLRDISIEPELSTSQLKLFPLATYMTERIHFFTYDLKKLWSLIKNNSYDAIYIWEEPYIVSGYTSAFLAKQNNTPYFFFGSQNLLKQYPFPISFFENWAQKNAVCTFACGQEVKKIMDTKGYRKAEYLPLFVSLDRFKPLTTEEKKQTLIKLELKELPTLGFMGRFVEEKGVTQFCNIVDKVLDKKECNIIVIGNGPLKESLNLWQKHKSNCRVLTLKHEEVPRVLGALDILLCPSQTREHWKEQFGRMIVEAFAAGVIVVGSQSGEIPHVMGDVGYCLPEANIQKWSEVILNILDSQKIISEQTQRGLERAKDFSVPVVAQKMIESMSRQLNLAQNL